MKVDSRVATREELASDMRAQGHTFKAISQELGCSITTVRRLVDPSENERSRFMSREAKRRRKGSCIDCGQPTSYNGHGISERCVVCGSIFNGAQRKVWTPETIIAAIREWADTHGEPPAMPDWSPTAARSLGDHERATRAETDDRWPHANTAIGEFGTWNAAIAAAGFAPRQPNGGGGNTYRRRDRRATAG